MGTTTIMTEAQCDIALLRLLTLFSPGFPIGAFAWSHGLENAVARGAVHDRETTRNWVETLVLHGSCWNDLLLLAAAWRAQKAADGQGLAEIAELAEALGGTNERRSETLALGAAFLDAARPWRRHDFPPMAYPVAVGAVAADIGLPLLPLLTAYAHAFAANLIAAATRLVPLGQADSVRLAHGMEEAVSQTAYRAMAEPLDALGSAALLSEIAAMQHETQSPRLFRS